MTTFFLLLVIAHQDTQLLNKNMFADLTLVTIAKTSQNYLMDEQNTTEPNSLKNHRFSV